MNMPVPELRKRARGGGLLLAVVLPMCYGCSGINVSKSVSPLDFLLPGLHMRNDPPAPAVPSGTNTLVCWRDGCNTPL